jgi:integrase
VAFLQERGEHITAASLRAYLDTMRARGVSEETVKNAYLRVRFWCTWLREGGDLDVDPFVGRDRVVLKKRPRELRVVYTREQIVKLLQATYQAVPSPSSRRPDPLEGRVRRDRDGLLEREPLEGRALVLLLLDSGLRAEEVTRLNCGDVRAAQRRVRGKGNTYLPWYCTEPVLAVLRELAGDRADDSPLFRGRFGQRHTTASLREVLERLARRADVALPPRPLHAFRHMAARTWKAAGLSDLVIMDLLRHSNLASTAHYTRGADVEALAEHHARVSPIGELLKRAA